VVLLRGAGLWQGERVSRHAGSRDEGILCCGRRRS
jgi:hypothetical protein